MATQKRKQQTPTPKTHKTTPTGYPQNPIKTYPLRIYVQVAVAGLGAHCGVVCDTAAEAGSEDEVGKRSNLEG